MEEKKTIFNYINQWFATFGIIIAIFIVLLLFVGDVAKDSSSLFQLGEKGMALSTLVQLIILAFIITTGRIAFYTDVLIKNMSLVLRNVLFFVSVIIAVVIFSFLFKWFPTNNVGAWIGFIVSFTVCTAVSLLITKIKEKSENDKMEKALEKFKH